MAFLREGGTGLPGCIESWRNGAWGPRVYVATEKGLYVGKDAPAFYDAAGSRRWWTFGGVTEVMRNGAGSIV